MSRTRFPQLGFRQDAPGVWRIVAVEDNASVGPHYASKAELLGDLERFAAFYGCEDAAPNPLRALLLETKQALDLVQIALDETLSEILDLDEADQIRLGSLLFRVEEALDQC